MFSSEKVQCDLFMICVLFYMYIYFNKMYDFKKGEGLGIIIQSNNLSAETRAAALWVLLIMTFEFCAPEGWDLRLWVCARKDVTKTPTKRQTIQELHIDRKAGLMGKVFQPTNRKTTRKLV